MTKDENNHLEKVVTLISQLRVHGTLARADLQNILINCNGCG